MPIATVRLDDEQAAWVTAQTTRYRKKADVIRDLIDSARNDLTASAKLGLSTEGESPSSSKAVSKERITKAIKSIPVLLEKHEGLIREFWKSKGGAKSDTAWKLLMTELEKLQKAYGDAVVKEQLELAINGRWKGVSMRLYEQFKAPKGNTPTQPSEPNREHGTGRVFTAADFYGETNPDNPIANLF